VISDDTIIKLLEPYGHVPTALVCQKIRDYLSILLKWNKKVSLTTVTDPSEIIRFHFGESILAVQSANIRNGRLADVGSGAGFPGLAIRLVAPDLSMTLIESNSKKATFLSEVCRAISCEDVRVLNCRMERCPPDIGEYDFVTTRAVGHLKDLTTWANGRLRPQGTIALWTSAREVDSIRGFTGFEWREPIRIPGTVARVIVFGERIT
jgi:16S rRNA (guanine527-N7)-methyltransferase